MKSLSQFICEKNELVTVIANELKKNGYNQTKASVKYRSLTWDSAIEITVKDLKIELESIEKIVKKFEKVRWDDKAQEILTGGNTYIDVKYDEKLVIAEKNRLKSLIKDTIDKMKANEGNWIKLKNGLELSLPKGYFGSEDLVYCYKWKGKTFMNNRDKGFIKPLWLLLFRTGL